MRVEIAQQRQHNVNNIRWWIAQHLRSCVRRREIVRARLQDTLRRLEWVATEFALVQRVDAQSRVRIDAYRPQLGMGMAAEWLGRLRGHCAMHLASLDALQVVAPPPAFAFSHSLYSLFSPLLSPLPCQGPRSQSIPRLPLTPLTFPYHPLCPPGDGVAGGERASVARRGPGPGARLAHGGALPGAETRGRGRGVGGLGLGVYR